MKVFITAILVLQSFFVLDSRNNLSVTDSCHQWLSYSQPQSSPVQEDHYYSIADIKDFPLKDNSAYPIGPASIENISNYHLSKVAEPYINYTHPLHSLRLLLLFPQHNFW